MYIRMACGSNLFRFVCAPYQGTNKEHYIVLLFRVEKHLFTSIFRNIPKTNAFIFYFVGVYIVVYGIYAGMSFKTSISFFQLSHCLLKAMTLTFIRKWNYKRKTNSMYFRWDKIYKGKAKQSKKRNKNMTSTAWK